MEDLTFVDHTDDAGYLEQVRNKLVEKEEVTSIDDLVDKVLKKVPERDCIGGLNLIGHAGAGTFGVGSGQDGGDPETNIDVREESWKEKLEPLKGRFCSDTGKVRLLGCGTSKGKESEQLLQEMADLLGVPVGGNARKECNITMFDTTGWVSHKSDYYLKWAKPGGGGRMYGTDEVWPP